MESKQNLRLIIRKIINEVFHDVKSETNYHCEKTSSHSICKFNYEGHEYGVIFRKIDETPEIFIKGENILKAFDTATNKYLIDFGVIINNEIDTKTTTNFQNPFSVIKTVIVIVKDFIKDNNVQILGYFAEEKRARVYKSIYDNLLKDDFVLYQKKQNEFFPTYFIKKDLL